MAYSLDNPPRMTVAGVGGGTPSLWFYDSPDPATTVRADGYISNGSDLGMKVGDFVMQSDSVGASVVHLYAVSSVTAGGSVDLTDGTAVTTTDTD